MGNSVKEIVFPLDRHYYISKGSTSSKSLADVLYLTITFSELKRLVKVSREHKVRTVSHNDIRVYSNTSSTTVKPKVVCHGSNWAEVYMPETYNIANFDWLLGQAELIEKGSKYTEYCLLNDESLIVLGTEVVLEGRSDTAPTALIAALWEEARNVSYIEGIPYVWEHFTDFIAIVEEKPHSAILSECTKPLIAEMVLRDSQDTGVYRVLQGISDAIQSL